MAIGEKDRINHHRQPQRLDDRLTIDENPEHKLLAIVSRHCRKIYDVRACLIDANGVQVQVFTREAQARGFRPSPLRWRIEATFGTLSTRNRRLICHWEQSPAAAGDSISIADCRRL